MALDPVLVFVANEVLRRVTQLYQQAALPPGASVYDDAERELLRSLEGVQRPLERLHPFVRLFNDKLDQFVRGGGRTLHPIELSDSLTPYEDLGGGPGRTGPQATTQKLEEIGRRLNDIHSLLRRIADNLSVS